MAQTISALDPAETPPQEHAFAFHGTAGEYFRIWIVNVCLSVLTLGIYSAWAKVRTERYFAASTRVAGAAFDYHADPITILKGRAIAFALMLAYFGSELVSPFVQLALTPFFIAAAPWAIIRSLAFRAHNTSWRGIRFAFGAPYGKAFAAYIGVPLLAVLTFGLAFPYSLYRQRRFIVDHAVFGTTRFAFGQTPGAFYRAFGVVLLLGLAALIAGAVAAAVGRGIGGDEAGATIGAVVGGIVALPLYFATFAYITAAILNLTYQGASVGPHELSSRVPPFSLGWIHMSNAVAILLSLGLLIPWAQVRLARFRLSHMSVMAVGDLDGFVAGQGDDVSSLGAEFGEAFDLDVGL